MYEKLIKCAAKKGFKIQSYIPRTHEIKTILSKNKRCLFFLLPKINQLPEYYMMLAEKYFFSRIWVGGASGPPSSSSPTPMPIFLLVAEWWSFQNDLPHVYIEHSFSIILQLTITKFGVFIKSLWSFRCRYYSCLPQCHILLLLGVVGVLTHEAAAVECRVTLKRRRVFLQAWHCLSGGCTVAKRLIGSGCSLGWSVGSVEGGCNR